MAKATIDTRLVTQIKQVEVSIEETTLVLSREEAQAVYEFVNGSAPRRAFQTNASFAIYGALATLGFKQAVRP